jgi:hypothetical protein
MAVDTYPQAGGLESPAASAFAVTPSDASDLPTLTRALFVGVSGNLVVTLVSDSASVTFANLSAGWHPIRARKIHATGTTAGSILGIA